MATRETAPGTINCAYRYRLYPTPEQAGQIDRTIGCRRLVYNHFLAEREEAWRRTQPELRVRRIVPGTKGSERPEWARDEHGGFVYDTVPNGSYDPAARPMTLFDTTKALTAFKREVVDDEGRPFLKDADAVALVYALRNLDSAYRNFFRDVKKAKAGGKGARALARRPRYKRRGAAGAYKTTAKNVCVSADGGSIKLPKLGFVRCAVHRPWQGEPVSATVRRVPSGRYYVSIQCRDVPKPEPTPATYPVGIEVGIEHAAVLSDGTFYDVPAADRAEDARLQKRLVRLKRSLSRRKGSGRGEAKSNRYRKLARQIARLEEHIAARRAYRIHAISHDIATTRSESYMRLTDWKGMLAKADPEEREVPRFLEQRRNRELACALPAELQRQIAYKTAWRGGTAVMVSGNPATTQTCSECGVRNPALAGSEGLSIREWDCPACGAHHQRDVNSARNLLAAGRAQAAVEDEAQEDSRD